MGKIISIINQKGGVGKTTTAVNLAAFLADKGYKTMLVDADSQGNATSGLSKDVEFEETLYDVLLDDVSIEEAVVKTDIKKLSILPASIDLAGAEIEMVSMEKREFLMKRKLDQVRDKYDFILIDCPPSLGLMTLNALVASQEILIPIQAEFYALEGLSQLVKTVQVVTRKLNPGLSILGILLTMFDGRTNLSLQVADEVKKYFGNKVFRTVIPRSVKLSEAPSFGEPILTYAPKSKGAEAYKKLCREVIKGLGELLGREVMEEKNTESISISLVVPNEWQPRREFEPESLNALAESIKEHGVVQPVIVRKKDSGYELIAGERRLRAAQLAGLVEIPALVRDYSDQETAEIALIENLQREDLNPLEEGLAYQRMISEYHFTQEKMANLIGKSRSYVTNMMRLLELSEEVKSLLLERKLTAGQARPLLGLETPAEQIALARRIVEEDLSARRIEEILRREKDGQKRKPADKADAYLRALEEDLVNAVGSRVKIKVGKGKNSHRGTISISFKSDKEFERITKLLKQGE